MTGLHLHANGYYFRDLQSSQLGLAHKIPKINTNTNQDLQMLVNFLEVEFKALKTTDHILSK